MYILNVFPNVKNDIFPISFKDVFLCLFYNIPVILPSVNFSKTFETMLDDFKQNWLKLYSVKDVDRHTYTWEDGTKWKKL